MTYFNPKVYCRENLNEKDRKEIDWWAETMINAVEDIRPVDVGEYRVLERIRYEETNLVLNCVLESMARKLDDIMIACIDEYESVENCENPTDYFDMIEQYLEAGNDKED